VGTLIQRKRTDDQKTLKDSVKKRVLLIKEKINFLNWHLTKEGRKTGNFLGAAGEREASKERQNIFHMIHVDLPSRFLTSGTPCVGR